MGRPADVATDDAERVQAGPKMDASAAIPARASRLLLFISRRSASYPRR
jgi:hypothetical protein